MADNKYLTGIKNLLGNDLFSRFVKVILTNRGSEFSSAKEIEKLGCRIFYCDPMCSWQKPHVENNHKIFRFICPKNTDLRASGLKNQDSVDLVFSHINSYVREAHDRSPVEVFSFFHPWCGLLERLNIKK